MSPWRCTLKRKNESGQGLTEYLLILFLVAIVVIALLMTIGRAIDNAYKVDTTGLDHATLHLGDVTVGHPITTSSQFERVKGKVGPDQELNVYSEAYLWSVSGCVVVVMPEGASALNVATQAVPEVAELVEIHMFPVGAPGATICVPDGVSVELYLWAE